MGWWRVCDGEGWGVVGRYGLDIMMCRLKDIEESLGWPV